MLKDDPWLERWLGLIRQKAAGAPLLELGCGRGWDTVELLSAVPEVIAADISGDNMQECARTAPGAQLVRMDIGKPFPFAEHSAAMIVASLSLHYFSWEVTRQIALELERCLREGSPLLARFNSINDHYFGASSDLEIEPNFYQVGDRTKRFFDEKTIRLFLQGWDIQFLEENVIHRYQRPKHVWEAMAVPAR